MAWTKGLPKSGLPLQTKKMEYIKESFQTAIRMLHCLTVQLGLEERHGEAEEGEKEEEKWRFDRVQKEEDRDESQS